VEEEYRPLLFSIA
jgi:polyisoprenoid-binding protein YceI